MKPLISALILMIAAGIAAGAPVMNGDGALLLSEVDITVPVGSIFDIRNHSKFSALDLSADLRGMVEEPQVKHQSTPSLAVTIPAPPATVLLVFHGILCIGFLKGRRKWAATIVAALALGRAGIEAIPRVCLASQNQNTAVSTDNYETVWSKTQRLASQAHAPAIDFMSMLRSLSGDADSASLSNLLSTDTLRETAAALLNLQAGADIFCLPLISSIFPPGDDAHGQSQFPRIHWARPPPC